MAKDLRTFLDECQREIPNEVIHVAKEVNPVNYDVTAIIKHLGAQKKFRNFSAQSANCPGPSKGSESPANGRALSRNGGASHPADRDC